MNFKYLVYSFYFLFTINVVFAQTQTNQKENRSIKKWNDEDLNFSNIPVFYYPGDDAEKKTSPKSTVQPQIDPVATGLRSNGERPVPIVKTSVRTITLNDAGNLLAIGTGQGEILIWSIPDKKYLTRWKAHDDWVFDLSFNEKTQTLISGGGDNYTKFWSIQGWKRTGEFLDHQDDVHGTALTNDGSHLVTGGDDTLVLARNLYSGQIKELKGHKAQVTSVVLSPDGKQAFSSSRDQTIRVWDLEKMDNVAILEGHKEDVLHLAIDSSGNYLASASYDGTVRIWSLETLKTENILKVPEVWMLSVEFSKDASLVFTGSTDFHVRAFDRKSEKELWKSKMNSDVSDLVLSSNGKQLFASSASTGIYLYEVGRDKGVVSQKINVTGYTTPRMAPLTTPEYLKMHHSLLYHQGRDDWGKRVGLLALHGDQFTDYLLNSMKIDELPAPKKELASRLRQRMRTKYKPFDETPLSERMLAKFWGKYAVAVAINLGIQDQLREWISDEIRDVRSTEANVKFNMNRFEKEIHSSLQKYAPENLDKTKIAEIKDELLKELRRSMEQ